MNFTKIITLIRSPGGKLQGKENENFAFLHFKFQHFQTSQQHQTLHMYSLGETMNFTKNNHFDPIAQWKVKGQRKSKCLLFNFYLSILNKFQITRLVYAYIPFICTNTYIYINLSIYLSICLLFLYLSIP